MGDLQIEVKVQREAGLAVELYKPPEKLDEKLRDGDEKAYIPLTLAKAKVQALTDEMKTMKKRHLEIISQITKASCVCLRSVVKRVRLQTYSQIQEENKQSATLVFVLASQRSFVR